jgi:hypothetical protein
MGTGSLMESIRIRLGDVFLFRGALCRGATLALWLFLCRGAWLSVEGLLWLSGFFSVEGLLLPPCLRNFFFASPNSPSWKGR